MMFSMLIIMIKNFSVQTNEKFHIGLDLGHSLIDRDR